MKRQVITAVLEDGKVVSTDIKDEVADPRVRRTASKIRKWWVY